MVDEGTDGERRQHPSHSTGDPSARPPAIEIDGLSKGFGSGPDAVQAVDNVSLTIEQGSIVGLLGPNGAGKTTLIKSALGMIVPDEGTVSVFGQPATGGRRAVYADVDAMLEGARNDYWRLTVRENLRYFATISGVDPDSVTGRHDRLLDRLGLSEKADTAVRDLSRGMKQKVSLASVLAGGAELVFLDEPTLGLDVESSRTLRRELRRLAEEEGITIVVSSHDMTTIEAVCDRVVVMTNGQIVADDAVGDLVASLDQEAVRITAIGLDEQAVDAVGEQFPLRSVEQRRDQTQIEVGVGGDQLYELFETLRAADVTPTRVHTVEQDLEAAFVDLTDTEEASQRRPERRPATADGGQAVASTEGQTRD